MFRPASKARGSSVITSGEIRERNEAQAVDLLREVPGLVFAQNGPRGSVADLFVRGGDSTYTLVLLDGILIQRASIRAAGSIFLQIPSGLHVPRSTWRADLSRLSYGSPCDR